MLISFSYKSSREDNLGLLGVLRGSVQTALEDGPGTAALDSRWSCAADFIVDLCRGPSREAPTNFAPDRPKLAGAFPRCPSTKINHKIRSARSQGFESRRSWTVFEKCWSRQSCPGTGLYLGSDSYKLRSGPKWAGPFPSRPATRINHNNRGPRSPGVDSPEPWPVFGGYEVGTCYR